MKLRIRTIGRTKYPNGAEIRIASINAVRNATISTPTATVFSIVMGAVSRKLLSTAMWPSIEGNERLLPASRYQTDTMTPIQVTMLRYRTKVINSTHNGTGGPIHWTFRTDE
jgi:hypothetical protein